MEIAFTPSPDVAVALNALLDKLERRLDHASRPIKVLLTELPFSAYFSQTDPEPRLIANDQLQQLAKLGLLTLSWLPGETGHLLAAVILQTEHATRLYDLLHRSPLAASRSRLESLLLADQFRFPGEDWRSRAVRHTLSQLCAGKSPAPFSLTNAEWNLDLLTILAALSSLEAETPYRVFSVRIFNDSKRFDELKSALVSLARRAHPAWKSLPAEELLRELNLVANPTHISMSGNWQITTTSGEVLLLGGFIPAVGFPAAQTVDIQSVSVHASAVLCIENLTTFHEFVRTHSRMSAHGKPYQTSSGDDYAILCTLGNPSPAIRHLLSLLHAETPIYIWADLDYGGFNILSQLRRWVSPRIYPYRMDISNFEAYAHLSHPLRQSDRDNLQRLRTRPELQDVQLVIDHLLKRGLKLEQEAFGLK